MDSWEDFDDEEPVAVAQGAYDEGNGFGDDDIKDSWDDDGDDEKTATPTTNQAPSKKKRSLQQILKEREAQEAQKLKEMAEKKAQMEKESLETEFERKARLAQAVRDADYQNAVALLGANNGTAAAASGVLDSMNPKTKEEFDKFSGLLVDKINSFKAKNSLLVGFLEKLFKDLAEPLEFSDIRKLSSTLATLSNEKQRAEKDKKTGKKGAKKAQVRVDAGNDMGPGAFNATEYDEYDDFM